MSVKYGKKSLKKLAVPIIALIAAIIFIFARGLFKNDSEGVTMAEVCKVLAYASGCGETDSDGKYWYSAYVDYIKEKNIFKKINPDSGFSQKNAGELFEYLGLTYENKYGVNDETSFTKEQIGRAHV